MKTHYHYIDQYSHRTRFLYRINITRVAENPEFDRVARPPKLWKEAYAKLWQELHFLRIFQFTSSSSLWSLISYTSVIENIWGQMAHWTLRYRGWGIDFRTWIVGVLHVHGEIPQLGDISRSEIPLSEGGFSRSKIPLLEATSTFFTRSIREEIPSLKAS